MTRKRNNKSDKSDKANNNETTRNNNINKGNNKETRDATSKVERDCSYTQTQKANPALVEISLRKLY